MRRIIFPVTLFFCSLLIFLGIPAERALSATSVDLSVSAYTWTPDPVVHNGTSTFTVTVTNNDYVVAVPDVHLVVSLPSNVDFSASSTPSGCYFNSGTRTTLTCDLATLAAQGTWNVTFTGLGLTPGAQSTNAVVSAPANTDPDANNDSLPKPVTVINGADLIITKTGPGGCVTGGCIANAGAVISFNIAVTNNGPDPATTFRVVDNLPAAVDFTYQSATGTGWTCNQVTTTVTCNYAGASIASGGSAPPITLTGILVTTAGSITNGASVASTDSSTGDPTQTNNGPSQVRVDVTQTTDLRANKTMVSAATGTTSYALGEAVTLTLSVTNQGPRNATGVTITDVVPTGFTIGTLPAGCVTVGQSITCTVTGTLNVSATSSNFVIPLTAPGSSGSGTNTATPARSTPVAGANTAASVNYTIAEATANLSAHKTMVSAVNGTTTFAYNEAVTLTLSVTNNGPQNATGVTITDDVPAVFVIGTLPSGCSAVGQVITCTVLGTLNNGASSLSYVIPLTAPGSFGSGSNTAIPGRTSPVAGTNTNASASYTVDAPYANLRANKTMVSAAPGTYNGTNTFIAGMAVTLTLSATNLGLHNAIGVVITDTISADFSVNSLPAGCAGGTGPGPITITCTVGALANGATSSSFVIPLTALVSTGAGSNNACVSRTLPAAGTDTCSSTVNYNIITPYAHLTLTKSKTPSLVANGANITNTIIVTNSNSSSSTATGTIRVTDVLDANETFGSFSGTGWSCSGVTAGNTGTLTCDYASANLARGSALPSIVITTVAANQQGNISNTACTGLSAGSPHTPADNSSTSNCATATVFGSNRHVDISITKAASIASPTHITAADNSFTYTLVVANGTVAAPGNIAPTVNISDPLPAYVNGSTTGTAIITGVAAGESCVFGSTVTCTLKDLTNGSPRTITITVNRRVLPGSFTNTATASTPDSIDTPGTKSASASIIIDPVADVLVTSIAAAPNPVKVGVQLTYTTSIRNNGPDTAETVILRHVIDPARMTYVSGSASLTVGGSCSYVSSFSGTPYAGQAGIQCDSFSLTSGESRQLVFRVIPIYPYPGGTPNTYVSDADITTTTSESNYVNSNTNTANITAESIDLTVTNNDPGYDPTAFGDFIIYQIRVQNNGPSQATGFMLTVTPTPPAQGTAPAPYTMIYNPVGSTLPGGTTCSQASSTAPVICYMAGSRAASIMEPNTNQMFNLKFDTGPMSNNPSGSKTYAARAVVSSYETGDTSPFAGDSIPGNNEVSETTTVLPKTDLAIISKAVSKSPVSINEPFTYTIIAANYGPSTAAGARVSDTLPSGLAVHGTITAALGSGTLSLNSCTSSGSPVTVACDVGVLPVASGSGDTPNLVTITIPVRAPYPSYTGPFDTNRANYATIAPLPNTSLDPTPGNNTSNTVNVQIQKSSIAGSVYTDNNRNDTMDSGEGINNVRFDLNGTDNWGNAITATNVRSNSSGVFLFDTLPPSDGTGSSTGYTIVETQPANYYDRFETVGTSGGTKPADICNGVINCRSDATGNTISAINLTSNTAASGYIFQEYRQATVSGYVYSDLNNNGQRAASGEPGISGISISLTGTDYKGAAVSMTTTTDGSGFYTFNVPPGQAGTNYTVTETSQPAGYYDGLEQNGTGNVVAGTAGRQLPGSATSEGIVIGQVDPNVSYTYRNFGELAAASITGSVFIDTNSDAVRQGGETGGVPNVTVTLAGTDYLAQNVCTSYPAQVPTCVFQTDGSGNFSITSLPPGTYSLTENPLPSGLTHTGAQAGSAGGTGGAGAGVTSITGITLGAAVTATGYNFGEYGQVISGYVYVDLNNNGVKNPGEPGISGVTVTLSGLTAGSVNVCTAIFPNPCSATTGSDGGYNFINIPASNPAGYTLTEQSQAVAPLTNYADGAESVGTVNGVVTGSAAVNDSFSGIVIAVGQSAINYNFGELGGSIAGRVYLDADLSGTFNAGDSGIANVTIALSGTTATGANVCTIISSCTTTTDAGGIFSFTGLPASNGSGYTLTETQPVDYASATTTPPAGNGTAASGIAITGISVGPGAAVTGALFGEKTGSIIGFVYHDANNDGVKDAGEIGIGGVTLTLSGNIASGADVCTTIASCTATTAADGSYTFSGLRNANGSGYTITETQPAGYLDGRETAGNQGGTVDNTGFDSTAARNRISAIPFNAAAAATGYNFGEVLSGSLSGRVYHDFNNNSSYEAGEELAGVTITLTGTNDQGTVINQAATTAANGTYSFTDLRPSDSSGYTLTETQPAGISDYPGVTGSQIGSLGGVATIVNIISAIPLASGQGGINYNFRENASSLSGYVYIDTNNNGSKDASEAGIEGVTITLSGTANRTTITDVNGYYSFIGLVNGTYTLTETHPVIYRDGRETAGTAGGTVDNSSFTNNPAQNRISAITLPAGTAGTGYLFGEQLGLPGSFSGKVWYNSITRDQTQQPGEPGIAGWRVEVRRGGVVRGSTLTAADGAWIVSGLTPGSGYEIVFRHPGNNSIYGIPISQDAGYVDSIPNYSAMTIANMVLRSGGNVVEQNLPIDPSGVVYDAITRLPVSGATVTLSGPSGFETYLAGSATQVTNATGFYQFLLLTGAPAGAYTLTVNGPAGYVPGTSAIIPPAAGPLNPGPGPSNYAVQVQAAPPAVSQVTTYYLSFVLSGSSANVVNNHLPIDPILGGAIIATKTTPLVNVKRGDLVPYTITMTNTLSATIPNIDVRDVIPPGFKYRTGSGTLNGVRTEPIISGRQLTWPNLTFTAGEKKTFLLILVVGSGVSEGEYVNQAYAANNIVNTAVSNVATATVRVIPDPTFDCPDIIGKVFDDKNANGYQDEGEPGIANVRLATVRGLIITTDAEGRFHVPCPEIPNENRGSNFILKLDDRTLPSGYRVTTENPRVVRLTRGKMTKMNFGATVHRVIRIDVNAAAFEKEGAKLQEEWQRKIGALEPLLRERSTVVRIAYRKGAESQKIVDSRIMAIRDMLQVLWKKGKNCPPLVFEEEIVEVR